MADAKEDAEILSKIQETYVPFLKKFITFLQKSKKATPDNINKLNAIYEIFTTATPAEQIETFRANKAKLQNWYNKAQKEKSTKDGETAKGSKRPVTLSDTESSQGVPEVIQPSAKKACTFTNSVDSESLDSSSTSTQASQIKVEKSDNSKVTQPVKSFASLLPKPMQSQPVSKPTQSQPVSQPTPAASSGDDPITYTCASCQFQTQEETEFMKHARTDHRTDLSMWCKQCGKCFSNAGVLVSHIKERACVKEEMIYKCGVKDCVFETTSGQTFVHHLRHCHKGSPFIFCVHCQKIFTLPHCLILHMQDDCPFKDRNRKYPSGGDGAPAQPKPTPQKPVTQPNITPSLKMGSFQGQSIRPIAPTPAVVSSMVRAPTQMPVRTPMQIVAPMRGRGSRGSFSRGRGRGRGKTRISDSSDSDDPDDPSWRPEELLGETGLRRSGRWAKKINDVMNPEPSSSGVTVSAAKKSFTSAELNEKMISCPCCDFMAAFQSVLEDHYIANHKVPNKNACLVCHLKFESIQAFHDHFEEHRSGLLPNKLPTEDIGEVQKQASNQMKISQAVSLNAERASTPTNQSTISDEVEPFDGVLTSIAAANLADPLADTKKDVKIPYQSAIHDKNMKDSKLKKFEELKSLNDLSSMKTIQKLSHFFKCGLYNCTFSTHSFTEYTEHLRTNHVGKRFHCCYCLKEELNCDNMAKHIAFKHQNRLYQCSKCFYRAYSKAHCQIHIKNSHSEDPCTEILECEPIQLPDTTNNENSPTEPLDTTWPYICALGECSYNTYDPKEFKKHNETTHRLVSVFFCHYCKVDFLTFKRLMNHYRLHGLNVFQCNYCIHGAETKEEILLHLCNAHGDEPLKAYMRGSQEEASSEVKQLNSVVREETAVMSLTKASSLQQTAVEIPSKDSKQNLFSGCENELYHVVDNVCYPKSMQSMCFPRFLKDLHLDVVCGVPFCIEKFETLHLYLSHLRNDHDALNYPCPHCPEMSESWEDFKNHLLCHGPKLYACGTNECEFYDSSKERTKKHKQEHHNSDSNGVALREFTATNEEDTLNSLDNSVKLPNVKETFCCLFCNYKCGNRNVMKNHIYKEMAYQRFDCSLCEKRCLSRKEIKDHFIASHPELNILCSTDYNLEIETMVKTILAQQQKFCDVKLAESCDMCCRRIKNHLRLQSHLYICLHKEFRAFECQHCHKNFVSLLAVKYHTNEEHHPNSILSSVVSNSAIAEDIEKNLLKIRLKQLRDVFEERNIEVDVDEKSHEVKFYTCSDCSFESHHKFNVERHNKLKHADTAKVVKGRERSSNSTDLNSQEENSNDSMSSRNVVKRYSCGFCVKKMLTIQEVEMHVKRAHTAKNADFFYYFSPSTSSIESDKNIYDCAYCKSTRENLPALKKHADLMHTEMEFKVKGVLSFTHSQNNYLACGYCYMKVDSLSYLQEHSSFAHPLLALKSIGGFQTIKTKRSNETLDEFPNKRVKFNSTVHVCSHCGGAFASLEAVTVHSKKTHSRLQLAYTKKDQSVKNADSTDFKFYKCELCRFTAEKHFLEKHLASKHKNRVTCSYCQKRFEFASKVKEHHEVFHKGLPIKYSQEAVSTGATSSNDSNLNSYGKNKEGKTDIPESVSCYEKKPEPIDLNSLTVHMKINDGSSADLPLVYVTEQFNLFPKVVLKDCMKRDIS